jgi:GGDEF domain-containing protein
MSSEAVEFYNWINVLNRVVESRDSYTRGHSQRVGEYAQAISLKVGYSEQEAERLRLAGLLHDIGKIGIPDALLLKPGRLDLREKQMIQSHSEISFKLLSDIANLDDVLPAVRHHHEAMDGSGYPDGLAGESIPLGARILAYADIFDALTSKRVYRDAMGLEKAKSIIKQDIDKGRLDPAIAPYAFDFYDTVALDTLIGQEKDLSELDRIRSQFFYQDRLTGLYNRDALLLLLKKTSYTDLFVSITTIDIERFKHYNQLYGTQKGDELLKRIADVLSTYDTNGGFLIPKDRGLYTFRLDSDRFFILFLGYGSDYFNYLIDKILKQLRNTFDVRFKSSRFLEHAKVPKNIEMEFAYLL